MKKFLSFIHWRHLKHLYHTQLKTSLHYRVVLEKFFQSKNGRMVAIILIAAAIPLTVIAAQQVQNLQQQAKETNECSESSYPLQVFPNPAEDGKEITFRLAEGTITEEAFQNDHFTGNGAVGCALSGGVIKCKARFNSKTKTKPQSDHTYSVHGNKCNYSVKNPDANKPTKPPKKVTNTPKPPRDPNKPTEEPTTGKCELTLSPYSCTGDNKPRMRATPTKGSGGNTPTPESKFGTPENVSASCTGTASDPQLKVSWTPNSAKSYTVNLSKSQGGSAAIKKEGVTGSSYTFKKADGFDKDITFWYTVIAVDGDKKSQPSSNTRNKKCTSTDFQLQGAVGAKTDCPDCPVNN